MICTSINGHVKHPEDRKLISAGPEGAFFCCTYGPLELAPAQTILKVYYTADFGREVFRVERGVPRPTLAELFTAWWRTHVHR